MAKIQFVLVLMTVLISTAASGSPITLTVDPGIVGQPASGAFDFHFNDLNGVTLGGQPFSAHFVFADLNLARLLLQSQLFVGLIIQTNANSSPGFAGSGPTGFLLAPGDLFGLTERLVQLARDPELCERLGRRGQELVKQWFPVEHMVDQLHALYLKLSVRHAIPSNP